MTQSAPQDLGHCFDWSNQFLLLRSSSPWSSRQRASAAGGSTPASPTQGCQRYSTVSRDLWGMSSPIPWPLARSSQTTDPSGRRDTQSPFISSARGILRWLEVCVTEGQAALFLEMFTNSAVLASLQSRQEVSKSEYCKHYSKSNIKQYWTFNAFLSSILLIKTKTKAVIQQNLATGAGWSSNRY